MKGNKILVVYENDAFILNTSPEDEKCVLLKLINVLAASVWNIFTLKSSIGHFFSTTLQLHNLLGEWAKELLKFLKDKASLLVCIWKNWEVLVSFWAMS